MASGAIHLSGSLACAGGELVNPEGRSFHHFSKCSVAESLAWQRKKDFNNMRVSCFSGRTILTQSQSVPGKLPFAAVVLEKIVLLLERTLVGVDDDRRAHLVLGRLLRALDDNM
ncbi:hypothetical protein EYF80_025341 [Liparis tanakae]|uniref:Uncharacterized protein n=1 Tax=Liparis tanakae TaxID=230148 RepID=A0A4Z2HFM0_9TELE|nr:hypothetical protein EYF80_025341 [Liparis tanakae]